MLGRLYVFLNWLLSTPCPYCQGREQHTYECPTYDPHHLVSPKR